MANYLEKLMLRYVAKVAVYGNKTSAKSWPRSKPSFIVQKAFLFIRPLLFIEKNRAVVIEFSLP